MITVLPERTACSAWSQILMMAASSPSAGKYCRSMCSCDTPNSRIDSTCLSLRCDSTGEFSTMWRA